jgi:hypothetical protein
MQNYNKHPERSFALFAKRSRRMRIKNENEGRILRLRGETTRRSAQDAQLWVNPKR